MSLTNYMTEPNGRFNEGFLRQLESVNTEDIKLVSLAIKHSIERAEPGNDDTKALNMLFDDFGVGVSQSFHMNFTHTRLPPPTFFEYIIEQGKSWLVPVDQFFSTPNFASEFILKIRQNIPNVIPANPETFWEVVCRISSQHNTSILFYLSINHTSRKYLASLIQASTGNIPPFLLDKEYFFKAFFQIQDKEEWCGVSPFTLFCQFDKPFIERLLINHPNFLSTDQEYFQKALVHSIETMASEKQTALSYLVSDSEGVGIFQRALSLAPGLLSVDPHLAAQALVVVPPSSLKYDEAAIDKILYNHGYLRTTIRQEVTSQVMFSDLALLHWMIRLNSSKALDVLTKLLISADSSLSQSSLGTIFFAVTDDKTLFGHSVLTWYMQEEKGVYLWTKVLEKYPGFLQDQTLAIRKMLDLKCSDGTYLIAKVCATTQGRTLFRQITKQSQRLFDEEVAKRFQPVLFSEQEVDGEPKTVLELLAYPEYSAIAEQPDDEQYLGTLADLIMRENLISEKGLQKWASELSKKRQNIDGEWYTIIALLSSYHGGRVFLFRFIQRFPQMIIWLLTHDFDNAIFLFSGLKENDWVQVFSKVPRSKRQAYFVTLGAAICQEEQGTELSVFFNWVMDDGGRQVLFQMLKEAPDIIDENIGKFSDALIKPYGTGTRFSALSWMVLEVGAFPLLWELFGHHEKVININIGGIVEALCIPSSQSMHSGVSALVETEDGVNLLYFIIRNYPQMLIAYGDRLVSALLRSYMVEEAIVKSSAPILKLFYSDFGHKVIFHLLNFYPILMEKYADQVATLLLESQTHRLATADGMLTLLKDWEGLKEALKPELDGNSVLLALVRFPGKSTLLERLVSGNFTLLKQSAKDVAEVLCRVVDGSINHAESVLSWMVCHEPLCRVLLHMITGLSEPSLSKIRDALRLPSFNSGGDTMEVVLLLQPSGPEVLKALTSVEHAGLINFISKRLTSFKLGRRQTNEPIEPEVGQSQPAELGEIVSTAPF